MLKKAEESSDPNNIQLIVDAYIVSGESEKSWWVRDQRLTGLNKKHFTDKNKEVLISEEEIISLARETPQEAVAAVVAPEPGAGQVTEEKGLLERLNPFEYARKKISELIEGWAIQKGAKKGVS